jgi:hypothetical protein
MAGILPAGKAATDPKTAEYSISSKPANLEIPPAAGNMSALPRQY